MQKALGFSISVLKHDLPLDAEELSLASSRLNNLRRRILHVVEFIVNNRNSVEIPPLSILLNALETSAKCDV